MCCSGKSVVDCTSCALVCGGFFVDLSNGGFLNVHIKPGRLAKLSACVPDEIQSAVASCLCAVSTVKTRLEADAGAQRMPTSS